MTVRSTRPPRASCISTISSSTRLQIRRQRRGELQPAAVGRVREREPRGVEERPLESQNRPQIRRHAPARPAVERVAHDRVADRAQVHADLVRAPGVDRHLAQRHAMQVLRRA